MIAMSPGLRGALVSMYKNLPDEKENNQEKLSILLNATSFSCNFYIFHFEQLHQNVLHTYIVYKLCTRYHLDELKTVK